MDEIKNIVKKQTPSSNQTDDLMDIEEELLSKGKDDPAISLLLMVPELARKHSPEELEHMRKKAMVEVGLNSPIVAALVELFWNSAISLSADLTNKKGHQQDPYIKALPVAKSE